MPLRTHTSKQYEAELHELREKLLQMGAVVEEMIAAAVDALVRSDLALAKATIRRDADVDALEMEVDELCLHILALRQPAARDLRFLTMALKIDTDLERMGDLASNIARRVRDHEGRPMPLHPADLTAMAERVRSMVDDCLDAFVEDDPDKARAVLDRDDEIDRFNSTLFRETVAEMEDATESVEAGQAVISVSKHLERIADHATNVAEMVIFAAEGKDVRHGLGRLAEQVRTRKAPPE